MVIKLKTDGYDVKSQLKIYKPRLFFKVLRERGLATKEAKGDKNQNKT